MLASCTGGVWKCHPHLLELLVWRIAAGSSASPQQVWRCSACHQVSATWSPGATLPEMWWRRQHGAVLFSETGLAVGACSEGVAGLLGLPSAWREGTLARWRPVAGKVCGCPTPCLPPLLCWEGIFLCFLPDFFPFRSLFKWQGCPAWNLTLTLVAAGAAARLPAMPPCPPRRGRSPAALPLPPPVNSEAVSQPRLQRRS